MNNIVFYPNEHIDVDIIKNYIPQPIKASSLVPNWFRSAPRYQNNEKEMIANKDSGYHNLTVRHCMPFIDAMTSGYFLTTWTDIKIERKNGEISISYEDENVVNNMGFPQLQYQKYFQSNIPQMQGYDPFLYAWSIYWRIKSPEGTSCLFTQPLNNPDLPFITMSGVIDTDKWYGSDVLNFALRENFEGVIPKGTPFVQIIPFKRESWKTEISYEIDQESKAKRNLVTNKRFEKESGYYRDNIWSTKRY